MSRETCVEITLKVPLDPSVSFPLAMAAAQVATLDIRKAVDDAELRRVTLVADGRRIQIGEEKLKEWMGA